MENARTFLKILEDRNNQMLLIMNHYTNYIILSLSAIWALFGKAFLDSSNSQGIFLIIAVNLTFFILISWRLYAHIIDNNIAYNYNRIIFHEKVLFHSDEQIPPFSTLRSLIKSCPLLDAELIMHNKRCYSQQQDIVSKLIDNKLIGYRNHYGFDVIVSILIFIAVIIELIIFYSMSVTLSQMAKSKFVFSIDIYILLIILILYLLLFNPNRSLPIQRDPTIANIDDIILYGEIRKKSNIRVLFDRIVATSIISTLIMFSILVFI